MKFIKNKRKKTNLLIIFWQFNNLSHVEKMSLEILSSIFLDNHPLKKRKLGIELLKNYDAIIETSVFYKNNQSFMTMEVEYLNDLQIEAKITKQMNKIIQQLLKDFIITQSEFNKAQNDYKFKIESLSENKINYARELAKSELFKNDQETLTYDVKKNLYKTIKLKNIAEIFYKLQNNQYNQTYLHAPEKILEFNSLVKHKPLQKNIFKKPKLHKFKKNIAKNESQIKVVLVYQFESDNLKASNLFNEVLGGDVFSKLFINVREKNSLCYYVRSKIDYDRQYFLVETGIEKANLTKFKRLVNAQIKKISEGDFTIELKKAKIKMQTEISKIKDSRIQITYFDLNSQLQKTKRTYKSEQIAYKSIKKAEVKKIASSSKLIGEMIVN